MIQKRTNLNFVDMLNMVFDPETSMMEPVGLHAIEMKRAHHLGDAQRALT